MLLSQRSLKSSVSNLALCQSTSQPTPAPSFPWPLYSTAHPQWLQFSKVPCAFSPVRVISLAQWPPSSSSPLDKSPLILQGPIKWQSFYLWSFPRVPRVSRHSIRVTRYFFPHTFTSSLDYLNDLWRQGWHRIHVSIPQAQTRVSLIHSQVHPAPGVEWMNTQTHQIDGQMYLEGPVQLSLLEPS